MPQNDPFSEFGGQSFTPAANESAAPAPKTSDPFAEFGGASAPARTSPPPAAPLIQTASSSDPFSAFGGKSAADAVHPSGQTEEPEDPNAPWYKKAWDWANAPLLDVGHVLGRDNATGFEKGLYDVLGGLTSPLSLLLTVGTFGSGTLLESGGAAALRAAGMAAEDITATTKGAQIFNKAFRTGKKFEDAWGEVAKAGINPETVKQGLESLKSSGINAESLFNHGIVRRTGSTLLRGLGMDPARAERVSTGVQSLINAGFTAQQAYGAAVMSPRVLDALKEGDYQTAERLAVNAAASGLLAVGGLRRLGHEAGEMMDAGRAALGLNVKPTEENLMLIRKFGEYDRKVETAGNTAKLWETDMRKQFKESPEELHNIFNYVQSGLDKTEMARRRNFIAQAAGIPVDDVAAAQEAPALASDAPAPQAPAVEAVAPAAYREGEVVPQQEKQPWEMTRDEFLSRFTPAEGPPLAYLDSNGERVPLTYKEAFERKLISKKQYDHRFGGLNEKQARGMYGKAAHFNAVYKALKEGKDVSPEVLAEYPDLKQPERRSNLAERKRVENLTSEERAHELLTSELTGLPNKRAFAEDETLSATHPHVGYADIDDFKAFNTELGHEGVDEKVLPVIGEIFRRAVAEEPEGSIKIYHRSGDEFLFRSKDADAIKRVVERVNADLKEARFTAEAPDGTIHEKIGAGLSHGTGRDAREAESVAGADKQARKAAGLRSGARDVPERVGQEPAQGQQAGGSEAQEVAPREMEESRIRELIAAGHLKKNYTPEEARKLVDSYDPSKITDRHHELAKTLRDYVSESLEHTQKVGVLKEGVENYLTHIWEKPNEATNRLMHDITHDGRYAVDTSMARKRLFMSAFEGELFGKKLAVTDPIAIAAHNRNTFARVVAMRETLDAIREHGVRASDGRPMVALATTGHVVDGNNGENPATLINPQNIRNVRISDKAIQGLKESGQLDKLIQEGKVVKFGDEHYAWDVHGYKTIDHPAFTDWNYASKDTAGNPILVKSELRVHPEAEEYLRRRLGLEKTLSKSAAGKVLLGAGAEAKGLLLSFSPFHFAQEALRALMTGISPFGKTKFNLAEDPVLANGVEHGLTLNQDYQGIRSFQEGTMRGHSKIVSKIPGLGKLQDQFQEFLFGKYIPGLKARAYKVLAEKYAKAYPEWTPEKVAQTAAADTNERFGGINYRRMGRSMATQDVLRVAALAPDWLESEIRFLGRTLGSEGKVARMDTAKMAVMLWGAARVLNYITTGEAHNEAPFGVAYKDEDGKEKVYSIRTLPTDMLHAVSQPGEFLAGRTAPLVKAGIQAYTGRDEYGRKVPTHNIAASLAQAVAPIPLQTAVKVIKGETPDISGTDAALKAAGLTVFPYRTEGQKLAAKLASSHSESGPVDEDKLAHHHALMHMEDQLRAGHIRPQDVYHLVETGQVAPKDVKTIFNNLKQTQGMTPDMARLYSQAARLPMKQMLELWGSLDSDEQLVLGSLLIKKRNAYFKKMAAEESPQQRLQDPVYLRLRRLFPQTAPF